ncbi:transglutaminase-like domain-containing protein [Hydrogenophaga sp.]|uniref:transglutaminase-like domain-containing protein n=1 Tax=Hydrogenophaga sp. TaxID=1904254 RepID=UPI0025B947F8|nr:transglutaminase-like domain-containing protein [Hydrogenophaga sp.]
MNRSDFSTNHSDVEQAARDRDSPQSWLVNTPLLDIQHPKIRLLALRLTQLQQGDRNKALACFQYVRELPFACLPDGNSVSALTVLRRGKGDCHTKSTLLVALLRAIQIPSRLRFVTLRADFLRGVIDLGTLPIEHCCVEVLIDDRWVAVDSHVMDPLLARAALARLDKENRDLGYGMHRRGATDWDGEQQAFAPFVADDTASLPVHDWGPFDDPYQFYSQVPEQRERLGIRGRLTWMVGARVVNRRVKALRDTAMGQLQAVASLSR